MKKKFTFELRVEGKIVRLNKYGDMGDIVVNGKYESDSSIGLSNDKYHLSCLSTEYDWNGKKHLADGDNINIELFIQSIKNWAKKQCVAGEIKVGGMVEISDDGKSWGKRELCAILPDDMSSRFVCRIHDRRDNHCSWKFCRPITQPKYSVDVKEIAIHDNLSYTFITIEENN